jgi:hypothetical protein
MAAAGSIRDGGAAAVHHSRHSGLTVAFNWPTVYFANAFSPIKLSSGEDFGD